MGRETSPAGPGAAALCVACAQEKGACAGACAGACGAWADSSAQVNAAPEGACVVTFGPAGEAGGRAAEVLDTFPSVRVEAERVEVRSQGPAEGSLTWGSGLVVHWGVLGRTGAHHWQFEGEPCHLGGWK